MRKASKVLSIALLFALLMVMQVQAEKFGGKWTSNPTYNMSTSAPYYSQFNSAISSWNSKLASIGTSIRYNYASITSASIIPNTDYYGSVGWSGYSEPGPDPYSGSYTYATVKFNRTYMDGYLKSDPTKVKAICTHEMGHALGLAHSLSSIPKTIMYQEGSSTYYDLWKLSDPTSEDVVHLDEIY